MEAEIAGARTNKDKSGSGKGQMDEIVDVSTGEVKLGCGNKILRSVAIGSCTIRRTESVRWRTLCCLVKHPNNMPRKQDMPTTASVI